MEEADGVGTGLRPTSREALRRALRAQASVLDRLLTAITVAYADELQRAGRAPEQRRAERVRRLLEGGAVDRSELDYDLGAWHLGAIAIGELAERAVRKLAAIVDLPLLSVPQSRESVWAWLGGRERLAHGEIERMRASVVAEEGVVLALGEPGRGVEGWRVTHRQAQAALLVARRGRDPSGVTRYGDVALLAFALSDEPLARSLVEVYLAPLEDQRDGGLILRRTLQAYFAAGRNVSAAAGALGVSRNTVESRLRTIEQSLGWPLPARLAELEVALRLQGLEDLAGSERQSPAA